MIKNIIFDFDGVLVDSEMLVARSFCRYLCERNIQFTENDFSQFAGKKTVNVISELSVKFNIDNEQGFFNDIMQISNEIYASELTPVPGALEFLESTAYNCFIGSNSGKERIVSGFITLGETAIVATLIKSFDPIQRKIEVNVAIKQI